MKKFFNYAPKNMYVWDCWCAVKDDRVHLYHLQQPRNQAGASQADLLGHAVSHDLVTWQELPCAFGPDDRRPDDDRQPWTGCALYHQNKMHLFYTMRGSADDCAKQAIGLAVSPDGTNFTRYTDNPIIVPDPYYYTDSEMPVPGIRDCRDLCVVKAPDKPGFYGYFATRKRQARCLGESSVIALAYSEDLIRWQQMPAAFEPRNSACVEVPDVFYLNGLWYMMCLTGLMYGSFDCLSDPDLTSGTIYAVAESPCGPFHELADNVVLGARTMACSLALKSFEYGKQRILLYTDREKTGKNDAGSACFGTVSTPKVLVTSGNTLLVKYCDRVESLLPHQQFLDPSQLRSVAANQDWGQIWKKTPIGAEISDAGEINLVNPAAFSILPLGWRAGYFLFAADIITQDAAGFGFVLRMNGQFEGDFLRLDFKNQRIEYIARWFDDFRETRRVKISVGTTVRLKVVSREEHLEVYLDDVLKMAFPRYRHIGGGVGLFVDRGSAKFCKLEFRYND